ncbi:MAG: UDP-N-acetylmuramate dehydrogenase [Acidimicrobiia bacterium]
MSREIGDDALLDHPVASLTTYRVGGRARIFVRVASEARLGRVAEVASRHGLPVIVVGRGSNMLVSDHGFDGIVVQLGDFAGRIEVGEPDAGTDRALVTAGAAVLLPVLARRTAAAGLAGFEWAVGVPGTIGGAIRMNAGGHGSDMSASLVDARVFDLSDGSVRVVARDDLGLRFRGSALSDESVVLDARLSLAAGDREASEASIEEIVRWRRENQPGGQNAGSVFVNPVPGEVAAGELIDRCGLRGFRIGTAEVSTKHANFIQSDVGGMAADVVAVMSHVRGVVADKTGHMMRSEIRLVGFDTTPRVPVS